MPPMATAFLSSLGKAAYYVLLAFASTPTWIYIGTGINILGGIQAIIIRWGGGGGSQKSGG